MTPLELWAGAECTVNRVGTRWFDQEARTGHDTRIDDIDRIAAIGVKRARVGVLWERIAPRGLATADWRSSDRRMARLRAHGIAPIVGLVHHGGGPAGTDLCHPTFPRRLAEFAAAVARRYPWVEAWTPINEPLTTARFSALYGHWYPHLLDIGACLRALVHEVQATVAAMAEIRAVIPGAALIQTEDLGRIHSTPELAYQAEYENHRRWLAFDLLAGRVDAEHPLRAHLEEPGIDALALDRLVAQPCPADIIGINYYVTSDRFLDHRTRRYPLQLVGGNGRVAYADVEAVRVAGVGIAGHGAIIEESWRRYGRPVAITEVHLACTREQQLRWLAEAWQAANAARCTGVDVRAVTAWSLFGAYDWHCLVTRDEGAYESGVFDVRAPTPRPTALFALARSLAHGQPLEHPILDSPGWWRSGAARLYAHAPESEPLPRAPPPRPLLVIGRGLLANGIVRRCAARGIHCVRTSPAQLDARSLFEAHDPWAVVAVHDPEGPSAAELAELAALARHCRGLGIRFAAFSDHRVFSGVGQRPWVESDAAVPRCREGRLRLQLERELVACAPDALVVRVGTLLDPETACEPLSLALRALSGYGRVSARDDEVVSISYLPHVVDAMLDLLIDGERGCWHGTNPGAATVFGIVARAAERLGVATTRLCRLHHTRARTAPAMQALASERAWPMPGIDTVLDQYVASLSGR